MEKRKVRISQEEFVENCNHIKEYYDELSKYFFIDTESLFYEICFQYLDMVSNMMCNSDEDYNNFYKWALDSFIDVDVKVSKERYISADSFYELWGSGEWK